MNTHSNSFKFKMAFVLCSMILLSACAQTVSVVQCVKDAPDGFWQGLWHGIIAPFSFFCSLFKDSIAIYNVNNNGGWYDFGFVLGSGILFGGGSKAMRK